MSKEPSFEEQSSIVTQADKQQFFSLIGDMLIEAYHDNSVKGVFMIVFREPPEPVEDDMNAFDVQLQHNFFDEEMIFSVVNNLTAHLFKQAKEKREQGSQN